MKTTRTFVALVVPGSLSTKLTRLQSLLAAGVPDVRWSTVAPFHVTLAFLGDVEDSELNRVCHAVNTASKGFSSFDLRIEGLGVFPNAENARTLWVGLTGPCVSSLFDLQKEIAAAVAATGYPHDQPVFQPHITLGSITRGRRPSPDLDPLLNHYRTWSAGSFSIHEVVTFASTVTREGPAYAPLARTLLAGGKPGSAT